MARRVLQQAGVTAAVAASVVALAAACGTGILGLGGPPQGLTCSDGVDADAVVGAGIFMDVWLFDPNPVTIALGQSVCWVNVDGTDHTVTPTGGGSAFGGSLSAGAPFLVDTFTVAGDYDYSCQVHTDMTGRIHVGS